MTVTLCTEYLLLQGEVQKILETLTELTTAQVHTFRAGDYASFAQLDKQLELTVGEKERAIGALRQHAREHRCHSTV
jgi:hypothetical protein